MRFYMEQLNLVLNIVLTTQIGIQVQQSLQSTRLCLSRCHDRSLYFVTQLCKYNHSTIPFHPNWFLTPSTSPSSLLKCSTTLILAPVYLSAKSIPRGIIQWLAQVCTSMNYCHLSWWMGNLNIAENQILGAALDNWMMVVLSRALGVISSVYLLNVPWKRGPRLVVHVDCACVNYKQPSRKMRFPSSR